MPRHELPEGSLPPEALPERDLETLEIELQHEPGDPRLDRFLAQRWPAYSRTTFQGLIRDGRVLVNDEPVTKPATEIHRGDRLFVTLYKRKALGIIPEPIPISVLYEDEDLIALNKAPGILVHPARGNPHGTLVNAVAYHAEQLSKGSDPFRPGVVHRLDRDTSGVIVFAKHDAAHARLARQWEARTVEKEYVTVVEGVPELDADVIDQPLGKDRHIREKYALALAIAGERDRGTLEVTLSRPLSRRRLFVTLYVAGLGFIGLLLAVLSITIVAATYAVGLGHELALGNVAQLWLAAWLLFVAFMSLAFAVSVSSDRAAPAIGIPAVFILLNYLAWAIGSLWPDARWLEDYSMFNLMKPQDIITAGLAPTDALILLAFTVACLAFALYRFPRRDLPAPS